MKGVGNDMNYWFSNHMASKLGIIIFGLLAFCLTILFTQ